MPQTNAHQDKADHHLNRDLRLMQWLLRRLVQSHGAASTWEHKHALRTDAGAYLNGDAEALDRMKSRVASMTNDELSELTDVIGLFFDLANLAEDRHRVRVLRHRTRHGIQKETLQDAIATLKQHGMPPEQIQQRLDQLRITPVLTAHPTEAKRRTIRRILRRLRADLIRLDHTHLLPHERREHIERMNRDLASLWYTDPLSARKPTVMDELKRTLFAVRAMWRAAPQLIEGFRKATTNHEALSTPRKALAFGNWVGGDRDGNPFVTAQVTRRTLEVLRDSAIRLHLRECRRIRRRLTLSDARGGHPEELIQAINKTVARWPHLHQKLDRLHPDEWFVHWLTIIEYRLNRSRGFRFQTQDHAAYRNTQELLADVELTARSLKAIDHHELLTGALQAWIDRIDCFGLHLLELDMRVNARTITTAISEIMRQTGATSDYQALTESERISAISQNAPSHLSPIDREVLSSDTRDLLSILSLAQKLKNEGYGESVGLIIISMTQAPSDVLGTRWLAQVASALEGQDSEITLAITPLFETISDLQHASSLLSEMLKDTGYRDSLKLQDHQQFCMIGYSDSAKDGGYVTANWSLFKAQRDLARCAAEHQVHLTLFHGRGGAIGRGGGPAARAILSLPPESVNGKLRLTEQGEITAERYDDPAIAKRHLEQLLWGTLTLETLNNQEPDESDLQLINRFSDQAEQHYRQLIENPSFLMYLRSCTVLPLIEHLHIGSRPSRRSGTARFEDLRAIPYTFAWNQIRVPLNAFYGLGHAFSALEPHEQQRLQQLYTTWPWLRAMIDNAELALVRCDTTIAHVYLDNAESPTDVEAIWQQFDHEFKRARQAVTSIKQEQALVEHNNWLNQSIQIRTPYINVLNLIQAELLRRQQKMGENPSSTLSQPLRRTVKAIAAGLRNTG